MKRSMYSIRDTRVVSDLAKTDTRVVSGKEEKHFGRVPLSVGSDERLSAVDVRVYWALSTATRWAGTVTMGQRRIASLACTSLTGVQRSISRLVECEHLTIWEAEGKKRQKYLLTSPVFSRRQGKENIVVVDKGGNKRLASVDRREVG